MNVKTISAALVLVLTVAAVIKLSGDTVRKAAGTEAIYERIDEVAEVAVETAKRLDDKIIQDRMDKIQERMWAMEDRWGEKFIAQNNRIHDTLEELLHFMTPEARDQYRQLQKDYEEYQRQLEEDDE